MKYEQDDGEWFVFNFKAGIRQQCCNCGLVHDFLFRRTARGYEMRIVRNERATVAARRKHRKKVIIVGEDD